ncbi:uncharacterized protein LOC112589204 isoform X1 [Harpegnathos saltator]|uniref:uncharacterized protein LOC112589204 isoform X1 n=1 Tax=Harpegnathos saltator TaxID=610380 RepID=UPI000DBED215|nr:uncharacterized protein LOC112589204 isoform X1 [Harpegnathos saltator]XP_025157316.1 uncharacterized protein LOC112589204 isoform X1 [Harpegnathos saltator]
MFVKPALNDAEWLELSAEFWKEWQFPYCVGAIDGKHVQIQAPQASQIYFNYKKTFNMVLLAVCDAHYNFIMLNVGAEGSQSDGGIFQSSEMGRRLSDGSLNLTKFTLLAARWRIFRRPIIAKEDNVESIIECAVCLHNFIRKTGDTKLNLQYCPPSFVEHELPTGELVEEAWHDIVAGENGAIINPRIHGPRMARGARNAALSVIQQRNVLKEFVDAPGAMRHQDIIVRIRQGIIPPQDVHLLS